MRISRCSRSSTEGRSRPGSRPPTRWLHHHPARAGSRQAGLPGARPAGALRRSGDRPRPLLDDRLQRVGELAAGASQRRLGRQPRELALAHNGNLINAVELHAELSAEGVTFSSTSDSEIIAALLASHPAHDMEDVVADVMPRLKGAYSTVVMTKDRVVAFRDPAGIRPLVARSARATATASPPSRAPSTSSARPTCATCRRARSSRSTRRG